MKRFLISMLSLGLLAVACAGQTVSVKVRAALYDRDLNLKPIPHLVVKLIPSAAGGQGITVQTNLDGIVEAQVPGGNYHVVTETAVELFDKSYRWDFDATFSRPENMLELSNDNAKSAPLAGSRDARVDELVYQFKRIKNVVVKVQTEHGAIEGLIVDPAGLVLTAHHPLEQATWLAVQLDDLRKLSAVVVVSDEQRDIALLRVNTSAAGEIAAAQISPAVDALLEGERVFTIENSGKDNEKKLYTGVISHTGSDEIVTDAKVSYPGSPLFNSSGNVVGIAQFSGNKFRIVPIAMASEALAEARQKLASAALPSSCLLPTIPRDPFPADTLQAPGRARWEKDVYSFKAGDFYVEFVTPVARYETDIENYEQGMKDYTKHSKGRVPPIKPEHKYDAVLIIAAVPKTKIPFWENMAAGRQAPTIMRYKTGFAKMRLLCGEKEVDPIWPGRVTEGGRQGWNVVLADESSGGRYLYTPDAVSPQCGRVTLQLFSTKDPDHPIEKLLDEKQVARIWQDFGPYRQAQGQHAGVAPQP
jgi:S1-C subfamily serine protease